MRILVVGGGPGGLFFSIVAKRCNPFHEIHVVEQNPEDATYGWGVAFTERAIAALRVDAPDIIDELISGQEWADRMEITVDNTTVPLLGFQFYRIGRADLLVLLQRYAAGEGVKLTFGQRVDSLSSRGEYDLVIGADGVNSSVRDLLAETLEPGVRLGSNWWAWYGTEQKFASTSLVFLRRPEGLVIGHAYGYSATRSGFVVEVTRSFFERCGLAGLGEEGSRLFCTELFADYLGGHPLLSNRTLWFQPKFVTCRHWSSGNVTLLGDALHTVHPSIGSGSRFAMRDAVALAHAVTECPGDAASAIALYERVRRPRADGFQQTALRSISWYEALADRDLGDPEMFAIEFAMRTGSVRWGEFRRRNKRLTRVFENPVPASAERRYRDEEQ
jgi:anthraniloyl-CoA monooxygenase